MCVCVSVCDCVCLFVCVYTHTRACMRIRVHVFSLPFLLHFHTHYNMRCCQSFHKFFRILLYRYAALDEMLSKYQVRAVKVLSSEMNCAENFRRFCELASLCRNEPHLMVYFLRMLLRRIFSRWVWWFAVKIGILFACAWSVFPVNGVERVPLDCSCPPWRPFLWFLVHCNCMEKKQTEREREGAVTTTDVYW